MDTLRNLGYLALGSRLRRLSDRLMQDGVRLYREAGLDFEPRWFPLYYHLSVNGPSSVTEAAEELGVSHPRVVQMAGELTTRRLVESEADPRDGRRRLLRLTADGVELLPRLQELWRDIGASLEDIAGEASERFLETLDRAEEALDRHSFYDRFSNRRTAGEEDPVDIVDLEPGDCAAFAALNEEWIENRFAMEEADRRALDNPLGDIVEPGGVVLVAREVRSGEVLGTCALIRHAHGQAELAKMAVAPKARGRHLGRRLGEETILRARALGFEAIYLETNSSLVPAITLYRSLGFEPIELDPNSEFERADVRMKLVLYDSEST